MATRGRLGGSLASVAVVALVLATAGPTRADGLGDIIALLEQFLEVARSLPGAESDAQLARLLAIIGEAERSYLRLQSLERSLDTLYPDRPDAVAPDPALEAAREHMLDRKARVDEAMTLAATVAQQRAAADLQLAALHAANLSPASIVAALQIGNEFLHQLNASVETLTEVQMELGQVDADQHAMEDWSRQQSNAWVRAHNPGGFWEGDRRWQPQYAHRAF